MSFNSFSKGLHTQYHPRFQPEGTYRNLLNAIRSKSGEISNEPGTSPILDLEGKKVLQSTVLGEEIILFLHPSEIGVLDKTDGYTSITTDDSLNFQLDKHLDVQARYNFQGHRLIYFTDRFNPPRYLNLDELPDTNFEQSSRLFASYEIPVTSVRSINEDGSLPTGVYQATARLLSSSTNPTSFGLLSPVVSVVDDLKSTGKDNYDGAPPGTASNKSITFRISNIDGDFAFLEIAIVRYEGIANQPVVEIVSRQPLSGNTTVDFKYYALTQAIETITLDELTQDTVSYQTAGFLEQKDNRLLISDLGAIPQADIQSIANAVVVKYNSEFIYSNENIQIGLPYSSGGGKDTGTSFTTFYDYHNELTAANEKSYRRGEVYSLALVPEYYDGFFGRAAHIPGNDKITSVTTDANTTTKQVGTYVSSLDYPVGLGYPTGKVRHHKMPTLSQSPHFESYGEGTYAIHPLALEIELPAIPDEIASRVKRWHLFRQPRTRENSSILSQGIAQNLIHFYTAPNSFYYLSPYTGKFPYCDTQIAGDQGNLEPPLNILVERKGDVFGYYSPESILLGDELKDATQIKNVLRLKGKGYCVAEKRTGVRNEKYWHSFLNYTTPEAVTSTTVNLDTTITKFSPRDDGNGDVLTAVDVQLDKNLCIRNQNGFLLLKSTGADLPVEDDLIGFKPEFWYDDKNNTDEVSLHVNGQVLNQDQASYIGDTTRFLFNLEKPQLAQYGFPFEASYIPCGPLSTSQPTVVYGGDTFISRFSVLSTTQEALIPLGITGLRFFTMNWFFVESNVNCNYRHYVAPQNNEPGTVPFYPRVKDFFTTNTSLFKLSPALGHPTGYNKQYSFENTLRRSYPWQLGEREVTEFPHLTLYSEKLLDGEQVDQYRVFLPNNLYSIPRHKGPITDTFVFNNTFYIRTPQTTWSTYFNEQTTVSSSSGEIVLGNGGLFPLPAREILTISGGYGGSLCAGPVNTPFGHYFLDNLQGKVFLLTDNLTEISDQGLFDYFREHMGASPDTLGNNLGYGMTYDYRYKRLLVTGQSSKGNFTLSYSPELQSWTSFHSYLPHHILSKGNRTFIALDQLYELGTGTPGVYGDTTYPMILDYIFNEEVMRTKTLDNLVLQQSVERADGTTVLGHTFSQLQVYNDTQNTDVLNLTRTPLEDLDWTFKEVSKEIRIAIPRDRVLDPEASLQDSANLVTSLPTEDSLRLFRPRIKGKYALVHLLYDNTATHHFTLYLIEAKGRDSYR